jgi:hypothetical protein
MKQATTLLLLTILVNLCLAHPAKAKYSTTSLDRESTFYLPGDSLQHSGIPSLNEMMSEIVRVTGIKGDFELKKADVLNIEASISHRKRYILYNATFINRLNSLTREKWAVMALLAHEIGHHLNGHTIKRGGSNPDVELEADEFAGFVLQKLGATLDQSQIVMHYIARAEPSKSHPSKNSRLSAIERGWNRAANTQQEVTTAVK